MIKIKEIKEGKKVSKKEVLEEEGEEQIFSIYSLKGVGPMTYEKLVNFGFDSLTNIANVNPKILSEKCDLGLKLSKQIVSEARKIASLDKFQSEPRQCHLARFELMLG